MTTTAATANITIANIAANAARPDEETRELMGKQACRMHTLAPLIFPFDAVRDGYRQQVRDMNRHMLRRFWSDNGPAALRRAMKLCELERHFCGCRICNNEFPSHRIGCRLWANFENFMANCGITWTVVVTESEDLFRAYRESDAVMGVPVVGEIRMAIYPTPEGFDPRTACPHMSPVSHIDLHIVFLRKGRHMAVVYGKKLWSEETVYGREIRKLDLLLARLRA
jgi:hypothetical protein